MESFEKYDKGTFLQDHLFVVEPTKEEIEKFESEGWKIYSKVERIDKKLELHFVRD